MNFWFWLYLITFILTGSFVQGAENGGSEKSELPLIVSSAAFQPVLLNLSPRLPVDMTFSNQEALIDNPVQIEAERQRIVHLFKEKSIPWMAILAVAAVLLFLLTSRKRKKASLAASSIHLR